MGLSGNELGLHEGMGVDTCPTDDFQNDRNGHFHVPEVLVVISHVTFSTIVQIYKYQEVIAKQHPSLCDG